MRARTITLTILGLLALLLVWGLYLLVKADSKVISKAGDTEKQKAIEMAKEVYLDQKANGVDFSSGPCLTNDLMTDWVADIAHNPRQSIDNDPQNQCSAFREGKAHHFVELDTKGELIRVY